MGKSVILAYWLLYGTQGSMLQVSVLNNYITICNTSLFFTFWESEWGMYGHIIALVIISCILYYLHVTV
jgi:hypothetical protein